MEEGDNLDKMMTQEYISLQITRNNLQAAIASFPGGNDPNKIIKWLDDTGTDLGDALEWHSAFSVAIKKHLSKR